MYRFDQGGFGS